MSKEKPPISNQRDMVPLQRVSFFKSFCVVYRELQARKVPITVKKHGRKLKSILLIVELEFLQVSWKFFNSLLQLSV